VCNALSAYEHLSTEISAVLNLSMISAAGPQFQVNCASSLELLQAEMGPQNRILGNNWGSFYRPDDSFPVTKATVSKCQSELKAVTSTRAQWPCCILIHCILAEGTTYPSYRLSNPSSSRIHDHMACPVLDVAVPTSVLQA